MRVLLLVILINCSLTLLAQRKLDSQESYIGFSVGANASRISNLNNMVNDKSVFPTDIGRYEDKSLWSLPELNTYISYVYAINNKFSVESRAGYTVYNGRMKYAEQLPSRRTVDSLPLQYDMKFKYNYFSLGQFITYNFIAEKSRNVNNNSFYASIGLCLDLIRNDNNISYSSNDRFKEEVDQFEQDNLRTIFKAQSQLRFDILFGYFFKLDNRNTLNVNISGTCPFLSPYDAIETQANEFFKIEKRNLFTILRLNVGLTFPSSSK